MYRLLTFVGVTLGGYVGWYGGEAMGFGFTANFLLSTVGSAVGVYAAWRIMIAFFD